MKISRADSVIIACVVVTTLVTMSIGVQRLMPRRQVVPFPSALLAGGSFVGDSGAQYVLGVWVDYQCPACSRLEAELTKIKARLGDSVTIVYKHFPALGGHPNALTAAVAAECARRQGEFIAMHRVLFSDPQLVEAGEWVELGRRAGISNPGDYDRCASRRETEGDVVRSVEVGRNLGIRGTPTLLVANRVVLGGMPADRLMEEIHK